MWNTCESIRRARAGDAGYDDGVGAGVDEAGENRLSTKISGFCTPSRQFLDNASCACGRDPPVFHRQCLHDGVFLVDGQVLPLMSKRTGASLSSCIKGVTSSQLFHCSRKRGCNQTRWIITPEDIIHERERHVDLKKKGYENAVAQATAARNPWYTLT